MSDTTDEQDLWTAAGVYYEYSKAVNPIGAGYITRVPIADFPHNLHEEGATRIIPFDLSGKLNCAGPATSPALCANFIRIRAGELIATNPNATSELYHVIRGRGRTSFRERELAWETGDFFTLPAGSGATHKAEEDAAFYWVHDEPLLTYLGVRATAPRFEPTLYPAARARAELHRVEEDPKAKARSRVSVLLANRVFDQTRTITHVLWAMFGVLPANTVQLPHRHESVALDYIIECDAGCYSLIGSEIDEQGKIKNPKRADWSPASAFVTPPGLWHSHHNESGSAAYLMPIQDAGLHTYLRTLDIKFFHKDHQAYISQK